MFGRDPIKFTMKLNLLILLAVLITGCAGTQPSNSLQVEVVPTIITLEENPRACASRRISGYERSPCTTYTLIRHRTVVRTHRYRRSPIHR